MGKLLRMAAPTVLLAISALGVSRAQTADHQGTPFGQDGLISTRAVAADRVIEFGKRNLGKVPVPKPVHDAPVAANRSVDPMSRHKTMGDLDELFTREDIKSSPFQSTATVQAEIATSQEPGLVPVPAAPDLQAVEEEYLQVDSHDANQGNEQYLSDSEFVEIEADDFVSFGEEESFINEDGWVCTSTVKEGYFGGRIPVLVLFGFKCKSPCCDGCCGDDVSATECSVTGDCGCLAANSCGCECAAGAGLGRGRLRSIWRSARNVDSNCGCSGGCGCNSGCEGGSGCGSGRCEGSGEAGSQVDYPGSSEPTPADPTGERTGVFSWRPPWLQ